jgi:GTP-binding protein Era
VSDANDTTATATTHRSGFVGVLGRPNVGKSTLVNKIVGEEVAIATPKPQTTRDRIRGIRTFDDWQVTFVDTPGIHEPRTRLNRYMVNLAFATIRETDLCYILIDCPKALDRHDQTMNQTAQIMSSVKETLKPCFLLPNKIDEVKDKSRLLGMIEKLSSLHDFEEIVPISARKGDGIDTLLKLTRARLPVGPPLYDADTFTDRPMRFLAAEMIREQVFMQLGQELPYNAAVHILDWKERPNGMVALHANIHVASKSHKPIVVGAGASRIKSIGQKARRRLEHFLQRKVYLDLRVKVDEGWLDKPSALRELGYTEIEIDETS